jgi:nucleotide-binding universal stress UspA family protein
MRLSATRAWRRIAITQDRSISDRHPRVAARFLRETTADTTFAEKPMNRTSSTDARATLQNARTIVAYTDDDGRYRHVRDAAFDVARDSGGRVILYALDEYSPVSDPVPNEWSSDRLEGQFGDPLTVHDLERLGREALAAQVLEATTQGIDAGVALPSEGGVDKMVEYAQRHDADVVLLPLEMEQDTGLLDRLVGRTRDEAIESDVENTVAVLFVGADGTIERAREESDG